MHAQITNRPGPKIIISIKSMNNKIKYKIMQQIVKKKFS